MNDESFFGLGRTFFMAVVSLAVTAVLILAGKMPGVITVESWTVLLGTINGIYAAKSGIHALANRSKKP